MLTRELSKLKESSKEAVEGYNTLNEFKEYLHIERPIEKDFIEVIKERADERGSVLILLNGNVGDGKSHLISYINRKYPEFMQNYSVHNDSTESFDPEKDSIQTLLQVLENFNDESIDNSSTKMILAINLGVLFRLSDDSQFKKSYSKLRKLILQSGILEAGSIVTSFQKENLNILSFSDYHLYELREEGPKSNYIMGLLERVTKVSENNSFYRAYKKDIEKGIYKSVHLNYELLMEEKVQKKITSLVIEAVVKNKLILSTRTILNFIYDLLVQDKKLLSDTIFQSEERSQLLKCLKELDPINRRHEKIDEIILEFYNAGLSAKAILERIEPKFRKFKEEDALNIEQALRMIYFLGEEREETFRDMLYQEYMENLYYSAARNRKKLRRISEDVMKSFYLWKNGSSFERDRYIFTSSLGARYKIAQELDWEVQRPYEQEVEEEEILSFKPSIDLQFKNSKGDVKGLSLDYKAYCLVKDILSGYCPNGHDLENSLVYTEFLDHLLKEWIKEDSEIYYDTELKEELKLTLKSYDDEDEYFLKEI